MQNLLLPLVVGAPAAIALLVTVLRPGGPAAGRWAVRGATIAVLAAIGLLVAVALDGRISWVVERDGRAAAGLTADLVGAVLTALTAGVALVVLAFARRALDGDPRAARFFALASALTSATILVALAATGTGLAVGWLATTASLVALIGHRAGWAPARAGARRTRTALVTGDLALVAGVVVAIASVGDLDLRAPAGDAVALGDRLSLVAVLLAVAGIARSALVPIHRWLPSTVAAPTPVSALLHAGVVNGVGVLVVRTAPITGASAAAMWLLFLAGAATAVLATAVMLVRSDVKGGLAWSTAGQMGFMTVQLAVGALAAAVFHLVGHAMYKSARFLGAGGAITAHGRSRHAPHPSRALSSWARRALASGVAATGTALAVVVVDPHVSDAGAVLLVLFAWCSAATMLDGWLRSIAPGPRVIGIGLVGGTLAPLAYVGGVAAFESAIADEVPFALPGAVGTTWLVATIVLVAAAAAAVRWAPGRRGTALRRALYGALLGFSVTPAPPARSVARAAADSAPAPSWVPVPALDRPFH